MDGRGFDALARRMQRDVNRRGIVRGGLMSLAATVMSVMSNVNDNAEAKKKKKKKTTLCLGGQTLTVPKKKAKKYFSQGATSGACPVVPPPPPPPPVVCPNQVECVSECCDKCCLPFVDNPDDVDERCASAVDVCCSEETGGGFCGPGEECCSGSGCGLNDVSVCCPAETGGGACPVDFPNCCPLDEGGSCCLEGESCCIEGEIDCAAEFTCVPELEDGAGCCIANEILRANPGGRHSRRSRGTPSTARSQFKKGRRN